MIALGLFSHFIADFVFQTKGLSETRKNKVFLGNLIHGIIIFFTYLSSFMIFYINSHYNIELILAIIGVTVVHIIIDLLKSLILKICKENTKIDLFVFLLDQLLHLVTVIIIFYFLEDKYDISNQCIINISIVSIYLLVIFIGDYAIRKTFKVIELKSYDKKQKDIQGVGSLIGKLERIIILTMLIVGHPEVIIALIGIKSIARFPEFNEEKNNDYFILGNLLSLLFAIIGYLLYIALINI